MKKYDSRILFRDKKISTEENKIKKLAYLGGIRGILIYMLLNIKDIENTFFIFEDDYNLLLNKDNFLIMNIDKISKKNKFFFKFKTYKYINRILNNFKEIWIHDHLAFSMIFLKKIKKINMVEDGYYNYQYEKIKKEKNKKFKIKIKNLLFMGSIFEEKYFGLSDNIKKIYLTGLNKIPEEIEKKVEKINIKYLLNKLSEEEKNSLLNIFRIDENSLKKYTDRKIIIITQPLSEDKLISEEMKIDIYKKIIKKYNQEDIVIKMHPREKTNYRKYFENIEIIEGAIPLEIIALYFQNIKKAITLFSTGIEAFEGICEIEFIGKDVIIKK